MVHAPTGRVALVTGAAKGIGAGIAKAMSAAGASVVVNFASDRAGAERAVAEIDAAGGKAFAIQANVSVVAEVERLLAEAVANVRAARHPREQRQPVRLRLARGDDG
jgi:3-oxoacyl-[acyl-carrier protein] reductase